MASVAECDADQARSLLPANTAELIEQAREEAAMWLAPAHKPDAKQHLAPTLALVAPVGMGKEEQATWLVTAMGTLSGIPADLLAKGCQAARLKVDHPAKIVAAIHGEIGSEWRRRQAALADVNTIAGLLVAPSEASPEYATADQIAAIKAELPIFRRVQERQRPAYQTNVPPRSPTSDEIAALTRELDEKYGRVHA